VNPQGTESAGKPVEVEGELTDRSGAADKTAPAALRLRRLEIGG